MANLKFSQFTEQTDTANVQFLVGYNGSTNVRIAPGNIGGTVTSVTTGDANTITIGGTAAAPTVAANTAAVTNGSLNLATGDQIYDFVIAQNYTSNTGTVTSVATTHAGNAFTATIGNVSTVNPSVDITLNGSSSQYIDGAGNLTTFPTITTGTVESVGLSMPAAFSVTNSPVTTSGTLTVTGAGTTSQYVDGTGALQTFPTIPTVPANIVETVTTTDGTFIDLTPNVATDGAVTVTADLSATGTPNSSSYLRGDNTWATIPGGFTSFDITGGSGSAQTITDGNTITLAQGTGISTVAAATDTVTITNTLPFNNLSFQGDSGALQQLTNAQSLTLTGGTGLSSVMSVNQVTFNANVDGTQSVAANTSTSTAARTYKVQVDSSDNLVVNVPWTSGSGGIAGSLADDQVAFGNGTNTIAGSDDFAWDGGTLTLGGSTGTGNLSAVFVTGDGMTSNTSINLGTVIQHQGDPNTKFGFPANDTFTIETNGLERLRIASAGQIGIGGTNYGTSGDVLTSNGPGSAPSWQAAGGGGNEFASGLYIGGTAAINLLDDYEEGTYTPTLSFSYVGGLYPMTATALAWYQKIGNTVFVDGYALVQGSGTQTVTFSSVTLPFTVEKNRNATRAVGLTNSSWDQYDNDYFCRANDNTTTLNFPSSANGNDTTTTITYTNPYSATLAFQIRYRTL